jgi:hypothetical protein
MSLSPDQLTSLEPPEPLVATTLRAESSKIPPNLNRSVLSASTALYTFGLMVSQSMMASYTVLMIPETPRSWRASAKVVPL